MTAQSVRAALPATTGGAGTPRQYSPAGILAVWAAAALPMAALAWVVAPRLAPHLGGPAPLGQALMVCLTAGMVWQFVLVLALVGFEQRTLRWSVLRPALRLHAPRSPRTGRTGGRVWLVVLPLTLAFGLVHASHLLPAVAAPADRDLGAVLASPAGGQLLHGDWGLFAVGLVMLVFNTVLGEELLFRGVLLPRTTGAFGQRDWLANGVLFALYHLHEWWVIPTVLLDAFVLVGPSKYYRSTWIGIAVHSSQSVFIGLVLLRLVL